MASTEPALTYETAEPNAYKWTRSAYDALVAGDLKARIGGIADARRVTVNGPCPRCAHDVLFDQLLDGVGGEDGPLTTLGQAIALPTPAYLEVIVTCRCTETHDHRPTGVSVGCGINFRIDLLDSND